MSIVLIYGLTGAALVGMATYAFAVGSHLLRRMLAFNLIGSGTFLLLGALARRADADSDPVANALIITGIVVSFAATALGVALIIAWHDRRKFALRKKADEGRTNG